MGLCEILFYFIVGCVKYFFWWKVSKLLLNVFFLYDEIRDNMLFLGE